MAASLLCQAILWKEREDRLQFDLLDSPAIYLANQGSQPGEWADDHSVSGVLG